MGVASQGEGSGKGSGGHQAPGVNMGMRREQAENDPYDTMDPLSRRPGSTPGRSGSMPPWLGGAAKKPA